MDPAHLSVLAGATRGVLATIKRDGRPQLSNVAFHLDAETALVRVSTRDPLAKTRNLRRDPRVSLHASTADMRSYVVAEGTAQLTAVAADVHDAVVEELVEHYRAINGEHPDWDDFRAAMVAEQRVLVRFVVERSYGLVL